MSTFEEKKRNLWQMKDCELAAVWAIHNPTLDRYKVRFMSLIEVDYAQKLEKLVAEEKEEQEKEKRMLLIETRARLIYEAQQLKEQAKE